MEEVFFLFCIIVLKYSGGEGKGVERCVRVGREDEEEEVGGRVGRGRGGKRCKRRENDEEFWQ